MRTKKAYLKYIVETLEEQKKDIKKIQEILTEKTNKIEFMKLENLGFSSQTYNCLYRHNIYNINDILNTNIEQIAKFNGIGKKALTEIIFIINKYGYKLKKR